MSYGFDQEEFAPIVVVWWRGPATRTELGACLDELTELYGQWSSPRLVLFDLSELGPADSAIRRQLASWRAKNRPLFDRAIGVAAYVFSSRLTRGYLTAVDWLRPAGGVRKVFGTRDEALAWLRGLLPPERT